jgi:hypothetical protein
MLSRFAQCVVLASTFGLVWGCGGQPEAPPPAATTPKPPPPPADDADPADEAVPARAFRTADVLAKLLPSNGTGCAPNTRCIKVTSSGRPQASGTSIAQCRGEFADFIVPNNTIPAGYAFRHGGIPLTQAATISCGAVFAVGDPVVEAARV